jgi:hypothetical protein
MAVSIAVICLVLSQYARLASQEITGSSTQSRPQIRNATEPWYLEVQEKIIDEYSEFDVPPTTPSDADTKEKRRLLGGFIFSTGVFGALIAQRFWPSSICRSQVRSRCAIQSPSQ